MNPVHAVWAASAVGAVLFYFGGYFTSKKGSALSAPALSPPVNLQLEGQLQEAERARQGTADELQATVAQLQAAQNEAQAAQNEAQAAKNEARAAKEEARVAQDEAEELRSETATTQVTPALPPTPVGPSAAETKLRADLTAAQRKLTEAKTDMDRRLKQARAEVDRQLKQAQAEVEAAKRAGASQGEAAGKLAAATKFNQEMTAKLAKMGQASQKMTAELTQAKATVANLTKQVQQAQSQGAAGGADLEGSILELEQKLDMRGKHIVKQSGEIERLRERLRAIGGTDTTGDISQQVARLRLKEKENADIAAKLKTSETKAREVANSLRAAERKIKSLETDVRRADAIAGDDREDTMDYAGPLKQEKTVITGRGEDLQESLRRMVASHDLSLAVISDHMGLPVAGIGDGAENLAAAGIMMVDEGRKAAQLCALDGVRKVSIEDDRGFTLSVSPRGDGTTGIAFTSLVDGEGPARSANDIVLDHAESVLL